jgi:hypothetical protein
VIHADRMQFKENSNYWRMREIAGLTTTMLHSNLMSMNQTKKSLNKTVQLEANECVKRQSGCMTM